MNEPTPEEWYLHRKKNVKEVLHTVNQKRKRIAWQRLLIVLLSFLVVYNTWNTIETWLIVCEIVAGLLIFLFTVSKDTDAKNEAINLQKLIDVNEKEINILNNNFQLYEDGEEYKPVNHVYADDLDIFGKASVYQYINRCTSQQGKELLAKRLLNPLQKEQIEGEQQAAADLKSKTIFRQQMQAFGIVSFLTVGAEKNTLKWLAEETPYKEKHWQIIAAIFPVFTIASIFLYLYDVINSAIFSLLVFVCMTFAFSLSKKIGATYDWLSKIVEQTDTFSKQLNLIESEIFSSEKMNQLQQSLKTENNKTASTEILQLNKILNRFNVRLNTLAFFFLNTFLLWDLQQILALNKWKQQNGNAIPHWFSAIAETEYSSSIATLLFNQPRWIIPVISNDFFNINGKEIGHPLLSQNIRVNNSFSLEGKGKVAIITGSNMGGKSTFLRSLGVNIVLALLGAPVCANSFSVSCIRLMSSMRVADNLAESTSTFYAELKKLKTIIEAVNEREKIFILLDEILRGTNSLDRHAGSAALLKQFIQKEAVAVIATHDVELAKLENDYPKSIQNYHFDVQAAGNELYFDYKLKDGICTSLNASILMKNIGIEIS